jgi:hypothetical protein
MVPIVASVAELPDAIKYAEDRPNSRWFVSRRAIALGAADQIPAEWGEAITAATEAADLNTAQRDALAKRGIALKDGSFPIRNRTDLSKAIRALGRAKNRAAAKRHILKRARALHSTDLLPDSYKPLTSATVSNDEAGLWVAQVRDLITESGNDPDAFEAGTDGFEADYEQYKDDPQGYVDELIAANADTDDTDDTDDESDESDDEKDADTVTEPEAAPAAPAQVVPTMPVAASGMMSAEQVAASYLTTATSGASPSVQIFTAPAAAPASPTVQIDVDALVAAIKAASKEAVDEALTAAKKPPVDDTTGQPLPAEDAALVPDDVPAPPDAAPPADAAPVDLGAAKEKLRGKFGPKPSKKPKDPPVAASAMTSAASMRERMAARTAS